MLCTPPAAAVPRARTDWEDAKYLKLLIADDTGPTSDGTKAFPRLRRRCSSRSSATEMTVTAHPSVQRRRVP